MKSITIEVPDNVDLSKDETLLLLAALLYQQGKISIGQGAEMNKISKEKFMSRLKDFDVYFINSTIDQVINDAAKAKHYSSRH